MLSSICKFMSISTFACIASNEGTCREDADGEDDAEAEADDDDDDIEDDDDVNDDGVMRGGGEDGLPLKGAQQDQADQGKPLLPS